MRGRLPLVTFIALLAALPQVNAVTTFYGGGLESDEGWSRVAFLNTTVFVSSGDFQHSPWEADSIMALAESGVKVNFRVDWWARLWNGEVAWNTSVVDLYYNSTLLALLEGELDWIFSFLDMERIWAVTLSEEGPGASYRHFWTPEKLSRYNETYHSETGYWLREQYGMNKTEEIAVESWLTAKNTWLFNHLYDYVKGRWPHLEVFQFIFLFPGAPPVWVGGSPLSGLKAEAHMGDLYFYDVYENPLWLYEYIRQFKTTYPDQEYHIWLWGEEPWPGFSGGFEHNRRNAWIAYLAGADGIGWFNWHYEHGWIWDRDDPTGKRMIAYTNTLNDELEELPVFTPRPQVLVIRDNMMSYQLGFCSELGVFSEWDAVSQMELVSQDIDLSAYELVVSTEDAYLDDVVERMNSYVREGGNLLLLGGFGWEQENYYHNGTRAEFLIERGVEQEHIWGDVAFNVSGGNPLGLNLQYVNLQSSVFGIPLEQLTENHQPIGEFSLTGEDENRSLECCPLVLYHNASGQSEGSILYWGVPRSNSVPNEEYGDVVESFISEWNYTRYLYRLVARAFAGNYLRLNGTLLEEGLENMIITQAEVDEGVLLAGVSNFYQEPVEFTYTLDLSRFDYDPGTYWVHSLDEGTTMGWFESEGYTLNVPIEVASQGTRLLVISDGALELDYSIDVFPEVPTAEDVEEFWPIKTTEEPEPQTEPEPEPEPEEETEPAPEQKGRGISGFPIISIVLGLALTIILLHPRGGGNVSYNIRV